MHDFNGVFRCSLVDSQCTAATIVCLSLDYWGEKAVLGPQMGAMKSVWNYISRIRSRAACPTSGGVGMVLNSFRLV